MLLVLYYSAKSNHLQKLENLQELINEQELVDVVEYLMTLRK